MSMSTNAGAVMSTITSMSMNAVVGMNTIMTRNTAAAAGMTITSRKNLMMTMRIMRRKKALSHC